MSEGNGKTKLLPFILIGGGLAVVLVVAKRRGK